MSSAKTTTSEMTSTAQSPGVIPPVAVWRVNHTITANSATMPAHAPNAPKPASLAILGGSIFVRGEGKGSDQRSAISHQLFDASSGHPMGDQWKRRLCFI